MRLVRGEGGRWQLATAEELKVGATVAVDLGREGVWPAKVEAFVSDLHVRVAYVEWDSWARCDEPTAVVLRSKVLPLPRRGRTGRAEVGDVGLFVFDVVTGYRLVRVIEVFEVGISVRLLPRRNSHTQRLTDVEEAEMRWCQPRYPPPKRGGPFLCTPLPRGCDSGGSSSTRALTTASQLAAWSSDPGLVTCQLGTFTTPTDFVNLRCGDALAAEAEWIQRIGDDALRVTAGENGGMRSLGVDRGHSLWHPVMCQVMIERIDPPSGSVMLDAMGGGNQRSMMWAWSGGHCISNDARPEVAAAGRQQLAQLQRRVPGCGSIDFVTGDAANLLSAQAVLQHLGRITFSLGSWAFWRQEVYDLERKTPSCLEHATLDQFKRRTKAALLAVMSCLVPGGVLALHLPQRISTQYDWAGDLKAYASSVLGVPRDMRDIVFLNRLGSKPKLMVTNYERTGDVVPETELVVFFRRPGGSIMRQPARAPVRRSGARFRVREEVMEGRIAAYTHAYVSAPTIQARPHKRARWSAVSARSVSKDPKMHGVTWRHTPRASLG